jgi:NAD(P)-dependent dehydrogenase (short-subunit alcohol dehydrogenase family)
MQALSILYVCQKLNLSKNANNRPARLSDVSPSAVMKIFEVNVVSAIKVLHFALPHLRQSKGRVVSLSSGQGSTTTVEGWAPYAMTKAAISTFIRLLAAEEKEISAYALLPGITSVSRLILPPRNIQPSSVV